MIKQKFQEIIRILRGKFGNDMVWSLASVAILAIGGILVNILIVHFRDEEALGIYNQVSAFYLILSQLIVFGFHQSVLRVISYHPEDKEKNYDSLFAGLLLVSITSIPIILISSFSAKLISEIYESQAMHLGLLLVLPGLWFFGMNKILLNNLNAVREMHAYAVFRSLRYLFITVIIIIVILTGLPNDWLSISLSAGELILFLLLFIYTFTKIYRLRLPKNLLANIKEHWSFGIRGAMSGVLLGFNSRIDILVLGYFLTDTEVGIYSFASLLAGGFHEIIAIARINVDPILGNHFSRNDKNGIETFSKKFKSYFYPFVCISGIALILFYPVFVKFFIDPASISQSWAIFAIIMTGVLLYSGYGALKGIILQGNRPGVYTIYTIALVLMNTILNILIVPISGLIGAASVTAFVYLLSALFIIFLSKQLFGIKL